MAVSNNLDPMPVVRELADFPRTSGNWLERAVFNNRMLVTLACLVVTLVLGLMATRVTLNASFDKMIPVGHPYIQNYLQNRSELRGMGYLRDAAQAGRGSGWSAGGCRAQQRAGVGDARGSAYATREPEVRGARQRARE